MAAFAEFRLGSNLKREMFTVWSWNAWMFGGSKFDGEHFQNHYHFFFLCENHSKGVFIILYRLGDFSTLLFLTAEMFPFRIQCVRAYSLTKMLNKV